MFFFFKIDDLGYRTLQMVGRETDFIEMELIPPL